MAANIHDHLTDQLFKAILSLKDEEQYYQRVEGHGTAPGGSAHAG